MSTITWQGVSSDNYGLYVEKFPVRPIPNSKFQQYSVLGKSGDFLHIDGSYDARFYENYIQPYDVYISEEAGGLEAAAKKIAVWLYASVPSYNQIDGYSRLEDSYDPLTYRAAQFIGPADIESTLAKFGRATIQFTCKPQRWYKSGINKVTLVNGVNNLTNPSYDSTLNFGFRINPYIWFTNLDGGVMIESDNGDQFYLDGTPAGNYRINSARMMVIGPGETDAYSNVSFINSYNFPSCVKKITLTLDAGATCDEMYMYPNWWTL